MRIWVRLDVDDLYRAAFKEGPAHRRSSAGVDGCALPQLQKFGWQIMSGHCMARIAIITENHSSVRATEPDGRSQERIKYHLQIERRSADDLKHIGRSGLLLQGFAQFIQQPRVLNGDDGLGSICLSEKERTSVR